MKMYEITEAYLSALQIEDDGELEKYLKAIDDEFDTKALNITHVIKDLETDIEALRKEEKRLATNRRSKESRMKWLISYLLENMKAIGKDQLEAGTFSLKIQKNPRKVVILDEASIGEEFMRVKKEIDKQKIKKELEAGAEIPGAELIQEEGLRIK